MSAGHRVVGESWGARLRIHGAEDLDPAFRAIASARANGFELREVAIREFEDVAALDKATEEDYPETPATRHDAISVEGLLALEASGQRLFGAWQPGELVAVTAVARDGDRAETEFTTVAPAWRRSGLATGAKGLSIASLAAEGVTLFGTGGAAANIGIIRASERLGYVVTERWVSFLVTQRSQA